MQRKRTSKVVAIILSVALIMVLVVLVRVTFLTAPASAKVTVAPKAIMPPVALDGALKMQQAFATATATATATAKLNTAQETQTALASVTIDAATRIAIAAHQLVYTTPQPVSVLDPTPTPDSAVATPTIPPDAVSLNSLALPTATPTTQGTIADVELYSPILNRSLPYRIYLPPNYDNTTLRYPVLYMLHGSSASYKEWTDYGLLSQADAMIRAGQVSPFIIVLPMGELGYWVNNANGGSRWADYVAYDVVGHIDTNYRTIANPENRAIGGLSMGGYGALEIGFNYPNIFKIVGAHSPTIRTQNEGTDVWGTDPAYFAQVDPLQLAQTKDLSGYKIWLDVGNNDTVSKPSTQALHDVLQQRAIVYTWNLFPGGHERVYWVAHVPDYVAFYTHAFTYK